MEVVMKFYMVLLVFVTTAIMAFIPAHENGADKAAIIKLNENQMVAFNARDYLATMEIWAHEPYIVHGFTEPPTVGWKAIDERYEKMFSRRNPAITYTARTASNYEIHINGNVAFILYDEKIEYTEDGDKKKNEYKTLKYFEKKNGKWKVVAVIPR
jgi:ketosteroid isomerase-like protein